MACCRGHHMKMNRGRREDELNMSLSFRVLLVVPAWNGKESMEKCSAEWAREGRDE